MRYWPVPLIAVALVGVSTSALPPVSAQDSHAAMQHRGTAVMGFDQDATAHHFMLYTDGGAIDVSVKNASNERDLRAIRSHLAHIRQRFAEGNFEAPMLVHDATNVPGTVEMARLRGALTYAYVETPLGGRVDILTSDRDALAAVHAFLRFQIADHRTGDSKDVRKR